MKKSRIICSIAFSLLFLFSCIVLLSATWFLNTYGSIGFSAIIYTLTSSNGGVEANIIYSYLLEAFFPALVITGIYFFILWSFFKKEIKIKKIKLYPCKTVISSVISIILSISFIIIGFSSVGFGKWIYSYTTKTDIYDNEYIDPNQTNINFPENKRNLIYIFMESFETSFLSKELGGGLEHNLIPELYDLAVNNTNFSHNDGVGGFPFVPNTNWTMSALISQTAGIPTNVSLDNIFGDDRGFMSGVTTLNDVLKKNGYYQTMMVGSDSGYGGRYEYFTEHGIDKFYDLYTAREDGIIPNDYHVWWGMEDYYLFEYAKQELTEISKGSKPFAFSMLTVDTHFANGYVCNECGDKYEQQYDNVIACSSNQVAGFVEWIKQQPFYENTTIVICGDHTSMDNGYFTKNIDKNYERHLYNCIINAPIETDNSKNRTFTPMDMFPTTIAALGATIEGDRLGLGVNLYSDNQTLAEKYTLVKFTDEIVKTSDYYNNNFYSKKK